MLEQTGRGRAGMRAKVRDTEIYFDVEGAGLVPDGAAMRERPIALVIHGGGKVSPDIPRYERNQRSPVRRPFPARS